MEVETRGLPRRELRAEIWISEASLYRDTETEYCAESGWEDAWSSCSSRLDENMGGPTCFLFPLHFYYGWPGR